MTQSAHHDVMRTDSDTRIVMLSIGPSRHLQAVSVGRIFTAVNQKGLAVLFGEAISPEVRRCRLTSASPRVLKALGFGFQLLESTTLSSRWFQN